MIKPPADLVEALGPRRRADAPRRLWHPTAKLSVTMQSPTGFHEQEPQQLRLPTTIQLAIVRTGNETEIVVVTVAETENHVKRVEVVTA